MIGLILMILATAQQTPPPAQAPPPVVQVPPPAPDSERLAAATRLVEALHIDRQYDSIFTLLIPAMTTQLFSSMRDSTKVSAQIRAYLADDAHRAEAQRLFAAEALKGFKARYAAFSAATASEYARAFTLDELRGLAAFYESPLGQKTLAVLPGLQQRLAPIGMSAGREVGIEAMKETLRKLDPSSPEPQI